jgi:hypothetical protein
MPTMISRGKELIRINPKDPKRLEESTNVGRTWIPRYNGQGTTGEFYDIMDAGKELLATTSKGLYYSINEGRTWIFRKH